MVTVNENVSGYHYGAAADGSGSSVTVNGDAASVCYAGSAAAAVNGGSVLIKGNAGSEYDVLRAEGESSSVVVLKNVTLEGDYGSGAYALGGGHIRIDGIITSAQKYITTGTVVKTIGDTTEPTSLTDYLTYADGTSTVWVKAELTVPVVPPSGVLGVSEHVDYTILEKNDIQIDTLPVTAASGSNTGVAGLSASQISGLFTSQADISVVFPDITGMSVFRLDIPGASLGSATPSSTLTIDSGFGSMTLSGSALSGSALSALSEKMSGTVGITVGLGDQTVLSEQQKTAVGGRPLIQLAMTVDGKPADWNNSGAPAVVSVPYTPAAEENQHLFAAARSITDGTGGGNFSPDAVLTRGQLIVMLMRAYGIAPDPSPSDNFTDAGNTYYTGYLAATKMQKIADGVGGNLFAPEQAITRQEMVTLLYNTLNAIGRLPKGSSFKALSDYPDAGEIAPWASDAMSLLVQAGTISGSGGRLNPSGEATRAEMTQVIFNLLSK